MPTVFVSDPIHPDGLAALRAAGHTVIEGPLKDKALDDAVARADALIVRSATKVTKDVVARAPKLRVVGRAGVGVDNVDLPACKARGIVVVNTPGASTNAVAELALAHMLAVARNLPLAATSMRGGQWLKKECAGFELKGRTLGLVGIGRIGARVGELARAFGMTVEAYDPYVTQERAKQLGVKVLHSKAIALAPRSDVISVHTPLTPETKGLVGKEFFAQAKAGLVVVNCARGGVVDEAALLDAVRAGKVIGAGLDVFETEPPGATPLVQHPRVSTTPHVGAATDEAQSQAGILVARDVVTVLAGGRPEGLVG